ncbi:hypothetical protein FNF29_01941 [Cafeteria roenbergensis]|uniref:Uncharacterized protein n=1 Tax=Cafeteria roenbergensis TaxID=33653 RepID=A0A5A8CSN3_CAFRO|nr:hypothetical protein FNF29_01941 [Cafeteria roenbergensis]|eukprot:KAA0155190.1 hypothetical protein FNF29_01941 [Cafeteria roenbergensis]
MRWAAAFAVSLAGAWAVSARGEDCPHLNLTTASRISTSCTLDAGEYTFDTLVIESGATMTLGGPARLEAATSIEVAGKLVSGGGAGQLVVVTPTLRVPAGGHVSADAKGYTADSHHSSCTTPGTRDGGRHGGGPVGTTCGDYEWPVLAGGGGRTGTRTGGTGGGSLLLLCNSTPSSVLDVNGTVSVDGQSGTSATSVNQQASGGGAGGSLLVVASRLSGTGVMSADGGSGADGYSSYDSNGGSGGRIAMHVSHSGRGDFRGTVRARAGAAYGSWSSQNAAGTVFWCERPGTAVDPDPETNRFGCGVRRVEADNAGRTTSTYHTQLALEGGRRRFEVDELYLGPSVHFSVSAPSEFDEDTMPDARTSLVLGNVTSSGSQVPTLFVEAGVTLTLAGLGDDDVQVGHVRTTSSQSAFAGESSWSTQVVRRTTVQRPLEVSVASLTVEEHGRAVLPPSVVVRNAALNVAGELVGVRSLTLDQGSSTTFSSAGATWVNDTAVGLSGESWAAWACGEGRVTTCASGGSVRASGGDRGRFGFSQLRMLGNAALTLGAGVTALGAVEVSVEDTSRLTLGALPSQQFRLTARDALRVAVGAVVSGDATGYTANSHHSSCTTPGTRDGGRHGGGPVGTTCGDYEWPVLAGGGGRTATRTGGTGGGSLLLLCNSTPSSVLDVNGTVSVDGQSGTSATSVNQQASGGGAGGSLLVVASRLSGTGVMSADGGNGANGYSSYDSRPGSGGRIAAHVLSSSWSGSIHACAGNPYGSYSNAPGTVYFCTGTQCGGASRSAMGNATDASTRRRVVVDACGRTVSWSAAIGDGSRPAEALDVVELSNRGVATLRPTRDAAKVPSTQLRVGSILGDNTGSLSIEPATSVVVLGTGSGWAPGKSEAVIRYTDAGERTLYTVQRVLTGKAELYFADMSLAAGGELHLPAVVSICNISLSLLGDVYGAETLKICQNAQTSASLSITGCKDPEANNFNVGAVHSDNSTCYYGGVRGCTYAVAANFDPLAEVNDGSCVLASGLENGCPYEAATNYLASSLDDGTCEFPDFGALAGQIESLEAQIVPLKTLLNATESQLTEEKQGRAADIARLEATIAQLTGNVTDLERLVRFFNSSCGPGSFEVASKLSAAEAAVETLQGNVSELLGQLNATTQRADAAEAEVQASDAKNALLLDDLAASRDQVAALTQRAEQAESQVVVTSANNTQLADELAICTLRGKFPI